MQQMTSDGYFMGSGRATKDADFKLVGDKQSPLCKLSIVVGKDQNDNARYCDIDAWWQLAEYGRVIKKGDAVFVIGQIQRREYNGKTYQTVQAEFLCAGKWPSAITGPSSIPSPVTTPVGTDITGIDQDPLPF